MSAEDWYGGWAAQHAAAFGMGLERPGDAAMFAAWEVAVEAKGITPDEAYEATRVILLAGTPVSRWDHASKFFSAVDAVRSEERRRRAASPAEYSWCAECGGTGVLSLPHPKSVREGRWVRPWHTLGVCCRCRTGRAEHERAKGITLDTYERLVPGYLDVVERRAEEIRADLELSRVAFVADRMHGRLGGAVDAVLGKLLGKG